MDILISHIFCFVHLFFTWSARRWPEKFPLSKIHGKRITRWIDDYAKDGGEELFTKMHGDFLPQIMQ